MGDVEIKVIPGRTESRQVSDFLCQEMLYDYLTGPMPPEERRRIEKKIDLSPHSQQIRENIKRGLFYCDQLAKTSLNDALLKNFLSEKSFNERIKLVIFGGWNPFLKWILQAALISGLTVGLALFVPWSKLPILSDWNEKTVELAKISGWVPTDSPQAPVTEHMAPPPSQAETNPPPATDPRSETEKIDSSGGFESSSKLPGFVYRVSMQSRDTEKISEETAKKIYSLGGLKAGHLELGWKRQGGSYFHFTLPENKFSEFIDYMKKSGSIKVSKDPHRRVMPEGTIRFILWLEGPQKQ